LRVRPGDLEGTLRVRPSLDVKADEDAGRFVI